MIFKQIKLPTSVIPLFHVVFTEQLMSGTPLHAWLKIAGQNGQ